MSYTCIETTYKNGTYFITNGRITVDTRTAESAERIEDAMGDGMPLGFIRGLQE